jgi:septum site-determining protein MinC
MTQGPAGPSFHQRWRKGGKNTAARVRIKGTRKGLAITLGEGDWHQLIGELDQRLIHGQAFFGGSRVNMHVGQRDLGQPELEQLIHILTKYNIEVERLHTTSRMAAEAAQALGVRLGLPEPARPEPQPPMPMGEWSDGVLLHRTLRSGQSLRQPGHVVIVGDVHAGAEVIAGGDVVVWGRLRGMVHAGAMGDEQALVCALELRPTQLRIASVIATSPDEKESKSPGPEIASVVDGQIVAIPWTSK